MKEDKMSEYTYDEIEQRNGDCTDNDKLVEEYLKNGGKINKVPEGKSSGVRRRMSKEDRPRTKWEKEMDKVTVPRDTNLVFTGSTAYLEHQQFGCMWLYYWIGKNQYEIADILGLSQPTVKEHIDKAKKKLRAFLKKKQ
jgi:predicted DNA-binding protein (UPF0251 family)